MSKIYPFKFLDSYGKDDTGLFFGRDEEIAALYSMIFESNILMVYGASGTGKTSIIQCGLASRFQPHDWLALYIRRGNNLNDSFEQAIADAGGITDAKDLEKAFKAIYRNSFRPVYLIFDQFEELFILGTKEEQTKFIQTVKAILNVEQPVKMIFSIREEYVGRLYDFEKDVPQLMRKKLRVEPMDYGKVKEVITGAANVPGSVISLKGGEEEGIALSIFTKLGGKDKSDTIQLPYLQVFLDKVYKTTIGDKPQGSDAVFTKAVINGMPAIGDILGDFLESQVKAISETLKVGETPVTAEAIWGILSPFATLQGTKAPQSIDGLMKELPKGSDRKIVEATVIELVTGRILKDKDKNDVYELMHDALAGKITSKLSNETRERREVTKILEDRVNQKVEDRELLSEKQLIRIDAVKNLILTPEQSKFVADSRADIKAQKDKQKKRIRLTIASLITGMILMGGLAFYSSKQSKAAEQKTSEAQSMALSSQAFTEIFKNNDLTKGIRYAQYAFQKDPGNLEALQAILACYLQQAVKDKQLFYLKSLQNKFGIYSATFFPDGNRVLIVLSDLTAKVWDVKNDTILHSFGAHTVFEEGSYHFRKPRNYLSAVSPDGKKVFTAFGDTVASVWNADNWELLYTIPKQAYHNVFASVAFSPDCSRIITIRTYDCMNMGGDCHHEVAELWDGVTGRKIARLSDSVRRSHDFPIQAGFVSSGSKAVTSWGNVVRLSDAKTGKIILTKGTNPEESETGGDHRYAPNLNIPAFSKRFDKVVITLKNAPAEVWDLEVGKKITDLTGSKDQIKYPILSPDGKSVFANINDSTAMLWNVSDGHASKKLKIKWFLPKSYNYAKGNACRFSPDSKCLLTISPDSFRLYNLDSSALVMSVKQGTGIYDYSDKQITIFSPDSKRILLNSDNNTVSIYNTTSGEKVADIAAHSDRISSFIFSQNGQHILTWALDNTVKIWDVRELYDSGYATNFSKDILYSGDGEKMILKHGNQGKIWNAETGTESSSLPDLGDLDAAFFSPDNKWLLTRLGMGPVKISDINKCKLSATVPNSGYSMMPKFSPDSKKAVININDSVSVLWDLENKKTIAKLRGRGDRSSSIVFSADSRLLWFEADNALYDVADGRKIGDLGADNICFSHDCKKVLAIVGNDAAELRSVPGLKVLAKFALKGKYQSGRYSMSVVLSKDESKALFVCDSVTVWDMKTAKEIANLGANFNSDLQARFSPDGDMVFTNVGIFSKENNYSTPVWNANNGQELKQLGGYFLHISPDGKFLMTIDRSADIHHRTCVKLWDLKNLVLLASIAVIGDNCCPSGEDVYFSPDSKRIIQINTHNYEQTPNKIEVFEIDPNVILNKIKNDIPDLPAKEKEQYSIHR